jgi:hypothetical protein
MSCVSCQRHLRPRDRGVISNSAALIGFLVFLQCVKPAQAQAAIPDCTSLGQWAAKFDRDAVWQTWQMRRPTRRSGFRRTSGTRSR